MVALSALYASIIFAAAFLLFLAEPMAARELLPVLGGSAAVWTVSLVFFQVALLAGYGYAHLLSRWPLRSQAWTHIGMLLAATALSGVHVKPALAGTVWHPARTELWLLTAIIGAPYFALAATTPLLQSWYLATFHSDPPWRFFALSNAASLLALLAYPAQLEPRLALTVQTHLWSDGFFLFAVLCGAVAFTLRGNAARLPERTQQEQPRPGTALLWLLLSGCGGLLLTAVTTHISQNIAAVPLLWILPLLAYLFSYIVAFHSPHRYPRGLVARLGAFALGLAAYLVYPTGRSLPVRIGVPLWCGVLFLLCWFLHGELYRLRPRSNVTGYYLLLALGSALGTAFAALAAPMLFVDNAELPCGLVLAAVLGLVLHWCAQWPARLFWISATLVLGYVGAVQSRVWQQDTVAALRSFYGTLRVTQTHAVAGPLITRTLYHGTIQHGTQLFGEGLRQMPTSYYAPQSGVGMALRLCCDDRPKRVGVVGLGAGTLAAYGKAGDVFRFYEIDPLVERLARAWFTYLRESPAQVQVLLGDARVSMARERPEHYDVLVLDAFSGDAVPVHLLTAEAIALYRKHLNPGGSLLFHISSQYVDLEPLLAREAEHAGLHAVVIHSSGHEEFGQFPADWVLMTASQELLRQPEIEQASRPATLRRDAPLWTDAQSSLLPLLK